MELTWKSRRTSETPEERGSQLSNIKRWDGASHSSSEWDCLRRVRYSLNNLVL